jgi:hypothetical protein
MGLFGKNRAERKREKAFAEFVKLLDYVERRLPSHDLKKIRSSGIEGISGLSDEEIIRSISFAIVATQTDEPENYCFDGEVAETTMRRMGVL